MHSRSRFSFAVSILGLGLVAGNAPAQTIHINVEDVSLRSGETIEFGDLYFIAANCSSLLMSAPEVEVMDGPPGVAVTIKQAMVGPRYHGCEKAVLGGKMLFSARDIEEYSHSRMVLRITYKTRGGSVHRSQNVNVTLFP